MTATYWKQWSTEEIDSMHGMEPSYNCDDDDIDVDYEEDEGEDEDIEISMDSLGMSWSDFF